MSQSLNQMIPVEVVYPTPLPDEECSSDTPFMTSSKMKSLSMGNVLTDDVFSQEQFLKFKNIVIKGCESAENLAYFHRNRPCFKKINCLCARLKQDVDRADSVLANINSQGVPWAVKDFIFVFTRIVSAWNIIKDYVYNNSDGMRTVKSAISDRLVVSFLKWQEVTSDFVEDLTKSFDGLQELTLSQTRNTESNQKNSDSNPSSNERKTFFSDTESFESFKVSPNKDGANEGPASDQSSDSSSSCKNLNVKQLSIGSDRKYDYIKTGVYKCTVARNAANGNNTHQTGVRRIAPMEKDQLKCHNVHPDEAKKCFFTNILSGIPNPVRKITTPERCHPLQSNFVKNPTDVQQEAAAMNLRKNPKSELLQKVCFIEESKFFFSSQFTKNYFPDFLKIVPNFIDLRSIIMKSEMEVLANVYEVVHQIRQIFYSAKLYLLERPHELLDKCVAIFEREFENLLLREFAEYDFKRMTGYDF
ncbi:protein mitoshell [Bradysia coprophila]|uniref:protein mitoshell n=1 Tax=Bradysia coprophila TaxID=38358 RepID=UPI00187DC2DA|nr:protein mitoshell [Bradysia coprophila]XP_037025541.1 protein mitoshell [Bradysia coprophila]